MQDLFVVLLNVIMCMASAIVSRAVCPRTKTFVMIGVQTDVVRAAGPRCNINTIFRGIVKSHP